MNCSGHRQAKAPADFSAFLVCFSAEFRVLCPLCGVLALFQLRPFASRVSTVWVCAVLVCKVMYQLKWVVPSAYSLNCREVSSVPSWRLSPDRREGPGQRQGRSAHLPSIRLPLSKESCRRNRRNTVVREKPSRAILTISRMRQLRPGWEGCEGLI